MSCSSVKPEIRPSSSAMGMVATRALLAVARRGVRRYGQVTAVSFWHPQWFPNCNGLKL
jgi:hypothetical protein